MDYKINSKLEKERIMVNAKFYKNKKKVHEINTAFPMDASLEVIREEVEKVGKLFEYEIEQKKEQKKVDEKFEKAQDTINQLNNSNK